MKSAYGLLVVVSLFMSAQIWAEGPGGSSGGFAYKDSSDLLLTKAIGAAVSDLEGVGQNCLAAAMNKVGYPAVDLAKLESIVKSTHRDYLDDTIRPDEKGDAQPLAFDYNEAGGYIMAKKTFFLAFATYAPSGATEYLVIETKKKLLHEAAHLLSYNEDQAAHLARVVLYGAQAKTCESVVRFSEVARTGTPYVKIARLDLNEFYNRQGPKTYPDDVKIAFGFYSSDKLYQYTLGTFGSVNYPLDNPSFDVKDPASIDRITDVALPVPVEQMDANQNAEVWVQMCLDCSEASHVTRDLSFQEKVDFSKITVDSPVVIKKLMHRYDNTLSYPLTLEFGRLP